MTKFKSQGLHNIRIKYWNASGSGSPSFHIGPNCVKICSTAQFYIQLFFRPHFGTWVLLFGPGRAGPRHTQSVFAIFYAKFSLFGGSSLKQWISTKLKLFHLTKGIIEKSWGEVFLMEQDKIESLSKRIRIFEKIN
jgi:hypothetical protein